MGRTLTRTTYRTALVLAVTCLLAACGFQLRGSLGGALLPDDWKSMNLRSGNPNSELSREVTSRFAANNIIWDDIGTANYQLILGPERFKQQNLSLNSEARAAEFELTMRAEFTVLDAQRQVVMEPTDAVVIKQMENDPRNVVGKAEEVNLLKGEMRAELAEQLLRRIAFYAASQQQATPSANPVDEAADAEPASE